MVSHTSLIWHYLGSFLLYTLLTVGILYALYWYLKKSPLITAKTKASQKAESTPETPLLEAEAVLGLEPGKTLYVIRSGTERFLMATTTDGIQLLSPLASNAEAIPNALPVASTPESESPSSQEEAPTELTDSATEPAVEIPWFTQRLNAKSSDTDGEPPTPDNVTKKTNGLGNRFLQSVQWLVSSRFK